MINDERTAVLSAIEAAGGIHTLTDLAHRWKVRRQRAHELSHEPDFPLPLMYIGKSPLYLGHEADRWRAGRPKGGGA